LLSPLSNLVYAITNFEIGAMIGGKVTFIRNLILGIAGALLGGWIVSFFADVTTFSVLGFLVAIGGACLIIFLFRLLFGGRKNNLPVYSHQTKRVGARTLRPS